MLFMTGKRSTPRKDALTASGAARVRAEHRDGANVARRGTTAKRATLAAASLCAALAASAPAANAQTHEAHSAAETPHTRVLRAPLPSDRFGFLGGVIIEQATELATPVPIGGV
ncbi:hypothetical protein [Streptomyces sp. NPDC048623]|uniref:hypothetical protein n=1 Tax=Streptomyces sp. NPDC048623 TaxID=3155761 RepID=UPI003430C5F9